MQAKFQDEEFMMGKEQIQSESEATVLACNCQHATRLLNQPENISCTKYCMGLASQLKALSAETIVLC